MRHQTVRIPAGPGIDWKGIGYLFSIAGVLLMGAEAIPKAGDPWWYWPALAGGVLTSLVGFGLRYMAHLKERREMAEVKKEAAES